MPTHTLHVQSSCVPRGAGEWWTTPDGKSSRYVLSPSALTALLEAAGFKDVAIQVRSAPACNVPCVEGALPCLGETCRACPCGLGSEGHIFWHNGCKVFVSLDDHQWGESICLITHQGKCSPAVFRRERCYECIKLF